MRGRLTEKADVFSFGVVALELVSGRPNSDPSLEEDKMYLLDWVCMLLLFHLLLYKKVNILIRTCLTISSHCHTTQQNDLTMSLLYISMYYTTFQKTFFLLNVTVTIYNELLQKQS